MLLTKIGDTTSATKFGKYQESSTEKLQFEELVWPSESCRAEARVLLNLKFGVVLMVLKSMVLDKHIKKVIKKEKSYKD